MVLLLLLVDVPDVLFVIEPEELRVPVSVVPVVVVELPWLVVVSVVREAHPTISAAAASKQTRCFIILILFPFRCRENHRPTPTRFHGANYEHAAEKPLLTAEERRA